MEREIKMQVFVRHQDLTAEIIKICEVTKPKKTVTGICVAVPADPQLAQQQFHGGWAMITGTN